MYIWDTQWLIDLGCTKEQAETLIAGGAKDGKYLAGFMKYAGFPEEIYKLALHESTINKA